MPVQSDPFIFHSVGSTSWFNDFFKLVEESSLLEKHHLDHLVQNAERIVRSVNLVKGLGFDEKKKVAEIGFGGVGLACALTLGAKVYAYDLVNSWERVCNFFNIPFHYLNLAHKISIDDGPFDIILFCEVIEHLNRWPVDILSELMTCLVPGGTLFLSTQNLHRLSNRIRMLQGKKLFANFVPEELVMGHLREYSPEEIHFLMSRAGFQNITWEYQCFPDKNSRLGIQKLYRYLCGCVPTLSNLFFIHGIR